MSELTELEHLLEETRVFHRNLRKDSSGRREDVVKTLRKLSELDSFGERLRSAVTLFNSSSHNPSVVERAKQILKIVKTEIGAAREILTNRLGSVEDKEIKANTDNIEVEEKVNTNEVITTLNMEEKFDLKTATSLLPMMDDSENVTKQLIDAIEM